MDGPLYSEVLRMGLDGEWEERDRKDGERRSIGPLIVTPAPSITIRDRLYFNLLMTHWAITVH